MNVQPWEATHTKRWHTNARFCNTGDTVGSHSTRVAVLLMQLMPDCSGDALRVAIVHDLGEYSTGDIAAPFKWANPDIAKVLKDAEAKSIVGMGLPLPELSDRESKMISLCDGLDAYLWARFHNHKFVSQRQDWQGMLGGLIDLAQELNVYDEFEVILAGVLHGKF